MYAIATTRLVFGTSARVCGHFFLGHRMATVTCCTLTHQTRIPYMRYCGARAFALEWRFGLLRDLAEPLKPQRAPGPLGFFFGRLSVALGPERRQFWPKNLLDFIQSCQESWGAIYDLTRLPILRACRRYLPPCRFTLGDLTALQDCFLEEVHGLPLLTVQSHTCISCFRTRSSISATRFPRAGMTYKDARLARPDFYKDRVGGRKTRQAGPPEVRKISRTSPAPAGWRWARPVSRARSAGAHHAHR